MKKLIARFNALPVLHRSIATFASLILIYFILNLYLVAPISIQLEDMNNKLSDLEYDLSKQRSLQRKLPTFEKDVAALDQKLRRLVLELPDQKEIDSFLRSISVLAVDTGLEVVKFSPKGEIPREFFIELPVQIELLGSFHKLITFFDELSRLSGIVNLKNLNLTIASPGGPNQPALLKIECQATTYRYDEGSREIKPTTRAGRVG